MSNKIKKIIFGSVIFVVTIIAISIFFIKFNNDHVEVSISASPDETRVFIDGSNKNSNGTSQFLTIGNHKIAFFLEGYKYLEEEIYVTDYNSNITKIMVPISMSEEDQYFISEKEATIFLQEDREKREKLQTEFPIIESLPYNPLHNSWGIWYELDEEYKNLTIVINILEYANASAINEAIDKLKEFDKSKSLEEYNIKFLGFESTLNDKFISNSETDPYTYLKSGFSSLSGNIRIATGTTKNEYYITHVSEVTSLNDENYYTEYNVILRKMGNSWKMEGFSPILTKYNTNNIPKNILEAANRTDFSY